MKYFLNEDYEYDFLLIGISCHEKDYRLCWALNQALSLKLTKEETGLEVFLKKNNNSSQHSVYVFKNQITHNEFFLLNNRSDSGYLIPEQSQADYLLMIKENYTFDFIQLLNKIKEVPFVLTAFQIHVAELKSKENLIF